MPEIESFMGLSGIDQLLVSFAFIMLFAVILVICWSFYDDKKSDQKIVQKELEKKYGKMS